MGILGRLVKQLLETNPGGVAALPNDMLTEEARHLAQQDDLFLFQRLSGVDKIEPPWPPREIEAKLYSALMHSRVDDFCFLLSSFCQQSALDTDRVRTGCNQLLRRGNIGGLERVLKLTGTQVRPPDEVVSRSYDALAASGRLDAIDYVRQLSGVRPTFSAEAVQTGYHSLLFAGRFGAVCKLHDMSQIDLDLSRDRIESFLDIAVRDLDLRGAYQFSCLSGVDVVSKGRSVIEMVRDILENHMEDQLPYLFKLFPETDISVLSEEAIARILETRDPECYLFVFGITSARMLWESHVRSSYRIAVERHHWRLLRRVCDIISEPIAQEDAKLLLDEALLDGDLEAVLFVLDNCIAAPVPSAGLLDGFILEKSRELAQDGAARMLKRFDTTYDPNLGAFVVCVKNGDFIEARRLYCAFPSIGRQISWAKQVMSAIDLVVS